MEEQVGSTQAGTVPSLGRGRMPAPDRRSGVILMETVIVLPILLMLLGGLFVIGDMLMSRLAAQELDRALAWRAVDRFGPTDFDDSAFRHIIGAQGITAMPGLYAYEATGSGMGNRWSSVFSGRSDVNVNVPWWTAFVNVQDAVMGDPDHPDRMESSYNLNSDGNGRFSQTPRTYVFRRYVNGGEREKPAASFPVSDIVCDRMAGVAVNASWTGNHLGTYERNPNAIIVSGDPGP